MAHYRELKIKNFLILFQIYYENRRSVSYSIRNDKVIVRLPKYINLKKSDRFIEKGRKWVEEQIDINPKLEYILPVKTFPTDFQLTLCDETVDFHISQPPGSPQKYLICESIPPISRTKIPYFETKWEKCLFIKKAISTTVRKKFADTITKEVYNLQHSFKIKAFQNLRFKYNATNWGSCSTKKNINLNTKISLLPKDTRSYIILHELGHLYHMDHSRDFWNRVEGWCPDYRDHILYLKKHSYKLDFYPYFTVTD